MFYIEYEDKIVLADDNKERLTNTLIFTPQYKDCEIKEGELEKGYDDNWYVKGYAPSKPQAIINQERANELHKLLEDADFWTSKYLDGEYTDEEWAEKVATRKAWREELRGLENNDS